MRKLLLILALAAGSLPGCEAQPKPAPRVNRQVLAFTASWCRPCQANEPMLADLRSQGAPITKVDIDSQGALATKYRITSVPTYVLVENGREVERTQDIHRLRVLLRTLRWIRQHTNASPQHTHRMRHLSAAG